MLFKTETRGEDMTASLDVKQAYRLAKSIYDDRDLVDIVDLGDMFGFVFVEWDPSLGKINRDLAYETYLITGYTTVDKKSGKTGELSAVSYFSNPKNKILRTINIEVVTDFI